MMDICSIRYETHLLVHWWTVVEAIRKSQGFVPLSESCLGCHRLLFRFEGVFPHATTPVVLHLFGASTARALDWWLLENCRASTSIFERNLKIDNLFFQANKSQRWMPWRQEPMKDVSDCEKLRGAVY